MAVTEMKAVHSRLLPPDHSPNPSKSTETPGNIRNHALPELTPQSPARDLKCRDLASILSHPFSLPWPASLGIENQLSCLNSHLSIPGPRAQINLLLSPANGLFLFGLGSVCVLG